MTQTEQINIIEQECLTPEDVAILLQLCIGRVRQMIRAGEIPHVWIGRRIRIPRTAWNAWMDQKTKAALQVVGMEQEK